MPDKASPGQRLRQTALGKSGFINDLVDVVNWFKGQRGGGRPTLGGGHPLKVKNLTGADRARGEVVQLGAALLDDVDPRNLWFEGNTPADPAEERFVILGEPLPEDAIGIAHGSGVCVAVVDVSDTAHTHARPAAGSHVLASDSSGPVEILSPLGSTGEQLVAVRFSKSCCEPEPTECLALDCAEPPRFLWIMPTGLVSDDPCDCENFNDCGIRVAYNGTGTSGSSLYCQWRGTIQYPCGVGRSSIALLTVLYDQDADETTVRVEGSGLSPETDGKRLIYFEDVISGRLDCEGLCDLVLPPVAAASKCDQTSATCTILCEEPETLCGPPNDATFEWNDGTQEWDLLTDNCVDPDEPCAPEEDGMTPGEQQTTPCVPPDECPTTDDTAFWEWDGDEWVLLNDNCETGVPCPPAEDGTEIGQTASTPCVPVEECGSYPTFGACCNSGGPGYDCFDGMPETGFDDAYGNHFTGCDEMGESYEFHAGEACADFPCVGPQDVVPCDGGSCLSCNWVWVEDESVMTTGPVGDPQTATTVNFEGEGYWNRADCCGSGNDCYCLGFPGQPGTFNGQTTTTSCVEDV